MPTPLTPLFSLCAGGMFTFPLMSPTLAAHSKLSQPHLTTIILAGMMSQYPVAVVVGSVTDQYGPSVCTFIGGLLFVTGFGGFSMEVYSTVAANVQHPSQASFYRMVICFLLIGLGTVFSYCASLFAASKYFASHIGLASGAMMAIFALSPLFFSSIATHFFMDSTTGLLNVVPFNVFLAFVTGLVSAFVSIILRQLPPPVIVEMDSDAIASDSTNEEETTPLLVPDSEVAAAVAIDKPKYPSTIRELVKTVDFWLFAVYCLFILGASEMVISNIGTISESLPAAPYHSTLASTSSSSAALQVKLLSIANTISRIVVGPLADFVSPIASFLPSGVRTFPRKHVISRFSFLAGAASLLSLTFIWLAVGVHNQAQLWALSIGTGLSYSATFTVIPSLLSSLWGLQHLGRNFGFMMYAPFTGTPIFSYIYASISASHTEVGETICKGRSCWELTFSFSIITSIFSILISFMLWKRWRNKI
ncbi:MFS general substrate transporter [Pholiota conissans]|uniref:MFS general substrate transporter n=1 Tax=Pholiota conissans TaxID=109636 RepID=A0A9P5ZDE9_9AGAR|nr:MFS general substrate transporter [Pholiota conissans]